MIELLFVTGIAFQLAILLGGEVKQKGGYAKFVAPVLLALGLIAAYVVSMVGELSFSVQDGLLTVGMVSAVFATSYVGFLSLTMMRKVSPLGLLMLHGLMLYVWIGNPEYHRFFVVDMVLPYTTFLVLLSLIPKLRSYALMRGLFTLWYFCLLLFFAVVLFSPLAEVFEPSPMLALISGMLFVTLQAYGFFALKYFLMVLTSLMDPSKNGMHYLGMISKITFPERVDLIREVLVLVAGMVLVALRYLQWVDDQLCIQLVLLVLVYATVVPTKSEREKIADIGKI